MGKEPRESGENQEELQQLREYGVFSVVDNPGGVNIVGCRYVFRRKFNADGSFSKYKVRLVAQGSSQRWSRRVPSALNLR